MGKLVVCVAENGHSYVLDCDECTLVEAVQKFLESVCGLAFNDQLLLCLDMKLESPRPIGAYKLPSDDREVFVFNKARMRSNSPLPGREQVELIDIPDPLLPASSHNPYLLDGLSDPALIALASYERQFRHHYQFGHGLCSRTLAKIKACERLLQEQKVQGRALEIARGNLERFYGIVVQNYRDFMKWYLQQHRYHISLLANFRKDMKKLRSVRLMPLLQSDNRKCLIDFIKVENLQKIVEDCSTSHRQFENKVLEFKQEFGDLKHNVENLFSAKAPFLVNELDLAIKDHRKVFNEQESIMQALRKDVNTVKKLVDDCLSSKLSSSLRPHDAVSALGPMYDSHESYLPKMQACEHEISRLLDFCRDKKNEMNMFVHNYMQSIAYMQYVIKDVRCKFSVFQEALKHQDNQFDHLKVVRGIGPAYRACLSEVVRRKAAMKIYMGKAGQLAEKLAIEKDAEVKRREEFLQVHNAYIPRDILASMGLYDMPNPCDVNVTPFDSNLLNIDLPDIDRYAPESLFGLRTSLSMFNDGPQSAEGEGSAINFHERLLEESELVEIAGTSKMEVENAKLKAELASKIALLCSISAELDCESPDGGKLDNILKNAAEKTSEALQLKDEYAKHLQSMLKAKQMQCESYQKRIQELEQRLSDQYQSGCKPPAHEDLCNSAVSSAKTDFKSEEVGEMHPAHSTEEVLCASSLLKSGLLPDHDKAQDGLDDNLTESSTMLNPQLDSSMIDYKGDIFDTDRKETTFSVGGLLLSACNSAVSISQLANVPSYDTVAESSSDVEASNNLAMELQNALSEKSIQLDNAEKKIQELTDEVSKLGRELEISQKLIDESEMNCAHLENCLHEARKEAQTHLCTANRRALEYNVLRVSAVKLRSLFGRLRSSVLSAGVEGIPVSLHALAKSLSSNAKESNDDGFAEFHECIQVLANKVNIMSSQHAELLNKAEAVNMKLIKELEEKKELANTLYMKHQLEKQVNKERQYLSAS